MKGDSRSAIRIHAPQLNIMTECMTVSGGDEKAINPRRTLREMRDDEARGVFISSITRTHPLPHRPRGAKARHAVSVLRRWLV